MHTETRTFHDEEGRLQFDFSSVGNFRFRYPYLIDARKLVDALQKLMATQLLEDQEIYLNEEINKLKSDNNY